MIDASELQPRGAGFQKYLRPWEKGSGECVSGNYVSNPGGHLTLKTQPAHFDQGAPQQSWDSGPSHCPSPLIDIQPSTRHSPAVLWQALIALLRGCVCSESKQLPPPAAYPRKPLISPTWSLGRSAGRRQARNFGVRDSQLAATAHTLERNCAL